MQFVNGNVDRNFAKTDIELVANYGRSDQSGCDAGRCRTCGAANRLAARRIAKKASNARGSAAIATGSCLQESGTQNHGFRSFDASPCR
jgi:hypothetical protein